jgi:hypothetical protein
MVCSKCLFFQHMPEQISAPSRGSENFINISNASPNWHGPCNVFPQSRTRAAGFRPARAHLLEGKAR